MPQQALYLKWRPLSFDDVVGQEHITRTLRNSLKTERIRHAYLFSGPRGTGKTTTARLLAKAVNCQDPDAERRPCNVCASCIAVNEGRYFDLIEIDAATHTGVDDVRDLRDKIAFAPGEGRFKVYIIDEVHRFTGNAFDALLKTLEEPPDHAVFVLATTEIDKVPATIKSRCLQFEFRRVSVREVADRLQLITETEGLATEREALELIARQGTGSVRDSISLLDQIVTDPDELISLALVQRVLGTASSTAVRALVDALIAQDVAAGLRVINAAIDAGTDPRQFGQQLVEHLRSVLLAQTAGADLLEAAEDDRRLFEQQAAQIGRAALVTAIRAFNEAVNDYKGGWQPQLALELALIESVRAPEAVAAVPAAQPHPAQAVTPQARETVPPPAVDAPPEATSPGAPPVIPTETVAAQWEAVLKQMGHIHRTSPEVMKHFRVHHVEGNTVFLCTDNEFFFGRVNPHPEKRQIVERALTDHFRQPLRIQLLQVTEAEMAAPTAVSEAQPTDAKDPLLDIAKRRGAQIRPATPDDQ
ncbi:MAG: DNA polymerase III subunit gamma/tau [Chloroflexi bacterium]|nr:DNA polymerase III subunit gamma/tau [Chloroflexota bacterium]